MINQLKYSGYFEKAVKAGRQTNLAPAVINRVLTDFAEAAVAQTAFLLAENQKDLDKMDPEDPNFDRLKLSAERIKNIAADIIAVTQLESPIGKTLSDKVMPNGLQISKVSVPLGVVGVIYEARPNVTFDVFTLCFKTGNVCVLKGGSDAANSNKAIIDVIHRVLSKHQIDIHVATLLPTEREATVAMFNAVGYIDVLIPRGSQNLINQVRQHSKVPVIETGAGIVHTYFDEFGDVNKATAIIFNAKTRRVSVCNALDCLLIHSARLADLTKIALPLADAQVELFADEAAYAILKKSYPKSLLNKANDEHYGTEFLSMKLAVKTVDNFEDALYHIAVHSSRHSEAIISEDVNNTEAFLNRVDAAVVYVNASTAFTDGGQFGLGAEIGISTQKLHARGPMGLQELTSYKWLVQGSGQVRQ